MGKIEEIKQNAEETFAISKKKSLDLIADEGKKLGDKIAELVEQVCKNTSEITKYKCKIAEIEKEIESEKAELLGLEKQKESFNNATREKERVTVAIRGHKQATKCKGQQF